MAEEVRLWRIQSSNRLQELKKSKLDLEERLEDWLDEDINILSSDVLVIDRQTETDFGGFIDLLCLDRNGDLVIVELKRHKTPREVTAQVLDYASWVKDLSRDSITTRADRYLSKKGVTLEEAFSKKFGTDLPEVLNENHRMLIVASEIDASSERIVKYLSDEYGVNINVATFQYFKAADGDELLARVFLIEPSQVEYKTQTKGVSKRRHNLTYEELQEIAKQNGVGNIYQPFVSGLNKFFAKHTTASSIAFTSDFNGSRRTVFSLSPANSNSEDGLYFQIYSQRFAERFKVDTETVKGLLPEKREDWAYYEGAPPDYAGFVGFFREKDIGRFLVELEQLAKAHTND